MPSPSSSQQPLRRRYFLKATGATFALPFLESLSPKALGSGSGSAQAGTLITMGAAVPPRRFAAIGNLLGFYLPEMFPKTTGSKYESTRLLKPLEKLRGDFTLFSGLDHDHKGGHFAVHSFLTSVLSMDAKSMPEGNISVDQRAAEIVGGATRFPSLTVGSETGIHGGCQMCWTRSGTRVPPIPGPRELFRKLFVNESSDDLAKVKDGLALRGSILDAVHGDAKAIGQRLDAPDREKLEEYFQSVRDVEKQLQQRTDWVEIAKPKAPIDEPKNSNMVDDLPLLYDLMVLALQTDSTRIATLEIGGDFEAKFFGINKGYHSLSHHGKREDYIRDLLTLEDHQMKHFARFLGKLKAIPEGGGTLLDHTMVLFGSGMSNASAHTNKNLPVFVAGGGFKHQGYRPMPGGPKKVPLSNLYLHLLQSFGVETDRFGVSTGTLEV